MYLELSYLLLQQLEKLPEVAQFFAFMRLLVILISVNPQLQLLQ